MSSTRGFNRRGNITSLLVLDPIAQWKLEGDLISIIDADDLSTSIQGSPFISDVEDVSSYNWLDKENATIVVPGQWRI